MKCSTPGCGHDVSQNDSTLCAMCRFRYQPSRFPLRQARTDIKQLRRYKVPTKTPPSHSRDRSRSRSEERELPSLKRKREEENSDLDSESLKQDVKRKRTDSSKRLERPPFPILTGRPESLSSSHMCLPLLFIPFEARFNNNMIGGFQRNGNQQSSIVESGKSFHIQHAEKPLDKHSMQSTFGRSSYWERGAGDFQKMDPLGDNKKQFKKVLDDESLSSQEFYQLVVEDRLRQLLFNPKSSPDQGLPEIIVLSERLMDWPTELLALGHRYTRQQILGKIPVQDMAAFVLSSAANAYRFTTQSRSSKYGGEPFTETWLLVHKIARYPQLTVACVHLSSKYTSVNTQDMSPILDQLISFARTHGIHAVVGDLNMNTYALHGGAFPMSNTFVLEKRKEKKEEKEEEKEKMTLKTIFSTSSGSGDKVYMGGMICDSRVSFRPTLTTFGNIALPPWFVSGKFSQKVFSDHHSLYCHYAFHGDGPRGRPKSHPDEAGGDCFFYALRRRLNSNETVLALRERIIDLITNSVILEPNMSAPRPVLVQKPPSNAAVPLWCRTPQDYLAQMRQAGRWVEDSLLPFIAQGLQLRFIIQYNGYHAVFETDGTRHDERGEGQAEQNDIFMFCEGNHFW